MGPRIEPIAIDDLGETALHEALGGLRDFVRSLGEFTMAHPGDCEDFVQRWLDWFASAAEGTLNRPNQLPEHPVPRTWRR